MKILSLMAVAVGSLAVVGATAVTPASADVVRKSVTSHHGMFGHGCRTVRTAVRGPHGKRVMVRKVCR